MKFVVFAGADGVSGVGIGVSWVSDGVYALICVENVLMDGVYALIIGKYEGIFGVYEGIFDVYEGIFDVYEGIFVVREGIFVVREGRIGVYEGIFGVCQGMIAVYEGIFDVREGIFDVREGMIGDYEGPDGVSEGTGGDFESKIVVAFGAGEAHNARGIVQPGAGMAHFDTAGLLYDSGVLYDTPGPQPSRNRMAKVKLGLQNLSPEEKIAQANTIKTALTGNANFTTPNPTLAALGTLITTAQTKVAAYDSACAAADTALADRDAALVALCAGLTQEAAYVENVSGGDRVKIESAGMSVRADGAPVGGPTQVLTLVLTEGDREGAIDAAWDAVRGAKSYEVQTSADPVSGTSWSFKMTAGKSSATLNSLTSGSRLWVRVRAIGAENAAGPWSDPAVKTVP
jgi:hypothetical protein